MRRVFEAVAGRHTPEMDKHFRTRTDRHIALVRKYCGKLASVPMHLDGIIERGEVHDDSKYAEPEMTPYIWLTWRYKCKDDGTECVLPSGYDGAGGKIAKATEHHILANAHHPEFHQGRTDELLNPADRDKPPAKIVDATKMSELDIAEMVADWCAMSEERGNTPREWADKNVGVRWKFTPSQKALIYKLIDSVWT